MRLPIAPLIVMDDKNVVERMYRVFKASQLQETKALDSENVCDPSSETGGQVTSVLYIQ